VAVDPGRVPDDARTVGSPVDLGGDLADFARRLVEQGVVAGVGLDTILTRPRFVMTVLTTDQPLLAASSGSA
jgi:hypothetical protein